MASVGEILRRERERQGLSLPMIADQTRIKKQFLEALEHDRYSELPGKFFVRAFATQYAGRLGMDTAELNVALQRTFQEPEVPAFGAEPAKPQAPMFPDRPAVAPLPEGTASALGAKRVAASAVMLVAVVVVCGLFFWLWQRTEISSTSAGVATPVRPGMSEPVAGVTVSPPAAQPATAVETAPPAKPATPVAAAGAEPINLVLTASDNVWVRVTADNRVVMEKLMVNGDSETAAAKGNARILMGNAGALGIQFNGANLGALGQPGQVKTVDFTPQNYQVLEPPRPTQGQGSSEPAAQSQTPPQPGT